jgi:hypothetical protein
MSINAKSTDNTPLSASQTSPEISFRRRIAAAIRRNPVAMAQIEMKKTSTTAVSAGARKVTSPAQIPTMPSSASNQRSSR